MESPRLRATRRCLRDDLALGEETGARDARSYVVEHDALKTFVTKRSGAPDEGDLVKDVNPRGRVKSLHVGRGRGVTLWDPDNDVCWLLAYSPTHATHERRDVYQYVLWLDSRGELLPTADDYESLDELPDVDFLEQVSDASRGLYEEARTHPGKEASRPFSDGGVLMVIDLVVDTEGEYEQGWYSVTFPATTPLAAPDVLDILSRLLPTSVDLDTLELSPDFNGEALTPFQVVWSWSCYPDEFAADKSA